MMEKTYAMMNEAMLKGYEQFAALSKAQFAPFSPMAVWGMDEWKGVAEANLNAFMKAATIMGKGWQSMADQMVGYNKKLADESLSNLKAFAKVKTLEEAVELQSGLARKGFDEAVTQGTKVSELTFKVANDAAAPIASRISETVETVSRKAAA
ncbi:MAG: phasin family protein [Alphaproteobacteria bacterium]|nr:phasin family protein [Alphaproteobacteria bacterium]